MQQMKLPLLASSMMKYRFEQFPDVVEHALNNVRFEKSTNLDALINSDLEARKIAADSEFS